ncbi:MAG: hypothetical protein M0Z95_15440 [Actinomycetota bacterium]|nr:hypothetical protein [Actinomycetota bacterium]
MPRPSDPTGTVVPDARKATERIPLGRALDNPAAQAVVAALGGAVFVLLRLAVVAKGDVSRFVMAGSEFVDRARAPAGLHVFAGTGYDGQFYYRLALDPADLSRTAFGITLDSFFRLQRIGYPLLSWLAAAGQHALVPNAEITVNVAALAVLAWLGGVIARDAGRHCSWGLLVAGYWGFLFSIARDLPEVVGSCFLVAGLVALRRQRPVLGGVLFAGAVLTIETTLDVVLAVALLSLVQLLRRRRRPSRQDAAWIIPGVTFAAWQLVCWAATGTLPMRADSGANLSWPFVNALGALAHYLGALPSVGSLIWLGELGALGLVTAAAGWALRRSRIPRWEKLAWGIALLVAVSLAHGIWYGRADFRGFEDLYVLSTIALLGSRRRLWVLAAIVAVVWLVTFAHRVVSL